MATQAMDRKKKDETSYHSDNYEDYENGKKRDKRQKKLNEFFEENEK